MPIFVAHGTPRNFNRLLEFLALPDGPQSHFAKIITKNLPRGGVIRRRPITHLRRVGPGLGKHVERCGRR